MPQYVSSSHKRTDSLDYLQSMLREMREIAEAERYDMLAYLIEMAYVEASDIIRGERPMRVRPSAPATTRSQQKRNSAS
ncbi:MAG: hypothetical protein KF849_10480 [Rhizobiaceae bacterium]|nr:hypothetical protein [Rhizobiaceae bacterium]